MQQTTAKNSGNNTVKLPDGRTLPPFVLHPFTDRFANQPAGSVKRKLWRRDDDHAHLLDAKCADIREAVLKRDNYSCRFCNFKSSRHQEVHHFDDDHGNNAPDNLLTCCNLCHQVHHIGMCAMRNAGFLAVIPEITQTEVNHIARAFFVSELIADQATKDKLTSLYAILQSRGHDTLKKIFVSDDASSTLDLSSAYTWADALSNAPDELYNNRLALLAPMRLVPTREAFAQEQLEHYATQSKAMFTATNWFALTEQLMAAA